jgi:GNAT superfamily N-acetyltransferase
MVAVGSPVEIIEVAAGHTRFAEVVGLASAVLDQARYLERQFPAALESHLLGAFHGSACVGFLRFVVQVIGADVGRPPVVHQGKALTEGYVEAFGVDPSFRRRGVGGALHAWAIRYCRAVGCHQMRSRSPVTSTENYALKLNAGYVLHPSEENDSYYFLLAL